MMRWLVLCFILANTTGILLPAVTEAQTTHTAADCSFTEVNAKVTGAVSGDMVIVPAGTCSWTSRLTVGSKSIKLQGAGPGTVTQCGAVGSQSTYTCIILDSTNTDGLVTWTLINTGSPRITGFTFDGGSTGSAVVNQGALITIDGESANWRFDNNRIVARRGHGMIFNGYVRGVNDHITIERRDSKFGFYAHHGRWGGGTNTCPSYATGCADRAFATATNFGSTDFLFFEDCTFERTAGASAYAMDGWKGQRVVVRLCTIANSAVVNHGTDSSARQRSGRAQEIYGNAFSITDAAFAGLMGARGGTGVFWGNEVTVSGSGSLTQIAQANHYRHSTNPSSAAECSEWYCADNTTLITSASSATDWHVGQGGLGSVRANSFDSAGSGYPAMDQTGRGQGDLITGDVFTGGATPVGFPNQALEPLYAWDNNINGINSPMTANGYGLATFINENRDFYTEGSLNGVKGSGARSARPGTCTTGEAYWSTDGGGNWNTSSSNPFGVQRTGADGALDKCTSANTWTNDWYVPYTYPHPLQGLGNQTSKFKGISGGHKISGKVTMQ